MTVDHNIPDVPWLLESKFEPNRPRVDLVPRSRLVTQLNEAVNKRLALIVAPAGYGKSSLLGQWAAGVAEKGIRYGWLTLEQGEADEKQFLAYIVLVLARAGVKLDELVTGARDGFADAATNAVLAKLVRSLNDEEGQIVLILEDYHSAECDAVNAIVKRLIRDTLSQFTIFIDSRRQPNIDAFSLIASGDAIEIDAQQLRLTKAETLLALRDVTDDNSGLEIYDQTEGWPVAVQLARVQRRNAPDEPILAGVDGGLIASYLTEQVLSTLDDDTQELLLTLAFLERFNPELVNFVLDSPKAWGRIDSLSSFAALIVPLDAKGGWYRLHHLFAEYLREMLTRQSHEKAKSILLRASRWHAEKKQLVEAVRYAANAGDFGECEALILAAGGWKIILHDGIGVLRSALRLLPDDVIASSARLMIARAYLHCKYGEIPEARAMLDASELIVDERRPELCDTDKLVVESMINLYEDRTSWTESHSRIRNRYSDPDCLDALGWGTIRCEEVLIHLSRAEFDLASARLREAFSFMRQSASVLGLNYCYIHAAHTAFYKGDLATAAANVERAGKMADENFGSDSGLKALASVLGYTLRIWKGECDRSEWPAFEETLFHTVENDGWVDIYMTGLQAAILFARQCGDVQAPYRILSKMRTFAQQRNLDRLLKFCAMHEHALTAHHGGGYIAAAVAPDAAGRFLQDYRYEENKRDWQSYLLGASVTAEMGKEDKPDRFGQALSLAENVGAGTWTLYLRLAQCVGHIRQGATDKAKQELISLLKSALHGRVMGPFIGNAEILRLLPALRSDLHQREEELITLQFIHEILDRAKMLNPVRDTGLLSEREYEVLQKLAIGMSNKEIARALELTENTVKFHLKSLFSKLSVNKRTQAVVEAQRLGLVD
ncbi:MAG: hypothetical protein CMI63_21285 [Parvularcula sp.]|nr:hypothetical protein [Parvularcula sp.]